MGPLPEIGLYVLQTIGSLYLALVVLRFMLQIARADFYNPISQFMVKATNPLVMPLRKVIPGLFGLDMASVVLAIVLHWGLIQASAMVSGYGFLNPFNVATWATLGIVGLVLAIYKWGLLISIILSWVAPHSPNPAVLLINQLSEPILRPIRKYMPDMGGLDLSPLLAFMLIHIAGILLNSAAAQAGIGRTVSGLVIGI